MSDMQPGSRRLPLIALAPGSILLPGSTVQVPLAGRGDIAALLAHIYSRLTAPGTENIVVGCVPLKGWPNSKALASPGQAGKEELFGYGCMARVVGVQGRLQSELSLVVEGTARFRMGEVMQEDPFLEAMVALVPETPVDVRDADFQTLFLTFKQRARELLALIRLTALLPGSPFVTLNPVLARRIDLYITRKSIEDAGTLADFMIQFVEGRPEDKLRILASTEVKERLQLVTELINGQLSAIQKNNRFMTFSTSKSGALDVDHHRKSQRELILRRALQGGQMGHGTNSFGSPFPGGASSSNDEEPNEVEELKKRLDEAGLSEEARRAADRELKRLARMNPAQAEYQVCRTYLENIAEIPWSKTTDDRLDSNMLARARKQLDDDHYGLEPIKKRLLEYLAVLRLKRSVKTNDKSEQPSQADPTRSSQGALLLHSQNMVDKSPILLLVGPPGTGKTSLAKSIAIALDREFHRISLGGVRDEAEIRGHRRTYVAAMPGLIVSGLKKVGVANPVILLDEIDKVGTSSFHGDPSAAMLEVLDPEQNHTFTDHYLNIPIDLSRVLFIATANTLDTIPAPLLDRMETISLSGYTTIEKKHIATRHLLPKQTILNGLSEGLIKVNDETLGKIITSYTREAGVRNLERELGSVCRSKAVQYAEAKDNSLLDTYKPTVSVDDLDDILGAERFEEEIAEKSSRPGVVTGLVAYSTGGQGSILFIEVADMPGKGRVQLTGRLGDVLKESVEVALSWVKAHGFELGLTHNPSEDIMKDRSIHVHCPSGAVPKDGPSAGLAHAIALISLFSGRPVPPVVAMTGELSLRGKVMPVGGIKEKLIGAHRAGVRAVLLPDSNRKSLRDVPDEVKEGLEIHFVHNIWEALRHVWPEAHWPGERDWSALDSRL